MSERVFQTANNASRQTDTRDTAVTALYQAAARLADMRRGPPKFKTRDLVGLLLSHGARSWRNSQPQAQVRVRVYSPTGKAALRLRVGR